MDLFHFSICTAIETVPRQKIFQIIFKHFNWNKSFFFERQNMKETISNSIHACMHRFNDISHWIFDSSSHCQWLCFSIISFNYFESIFLKNQYLQWICLFLCFPTNKSLICKHLMRISLFIFAVILHKTRIFSDKKSFSAQIKTFKVHRICINGQTFRTIFSFRIKLFRMLR